MEAEQKESKHYFIFIRIIILLLITFLSFFMGTRIGLKGIEKATIAEETYEPKPKRQFSNKIAVVDLDDGIEEDNEKKYYSKEIIELPNLDFVYTGLGDARTGLEEGTYGAYVLIPSTFSESVESLNKNPMKAKLKFEINSKLDGETKSQVLYNLLQFEKKINNDLSYIYVNNILKEFHEAQDISELVMENDLKDQKAILGIQVTDLVELVDMPELERADNNAEPIDISNYVSQNQDLISEINEEYKNQIEMNLNGLYDLKQDGATLVNELNKMIAAVGQVDVIRDENGKVVYEDGVKNLNNEIVTYNTNLISNRANIQEGVGKIIQNQNSINNILSTDNILLKLNKYNEKLESTKREKEEELKEYLLQFIPQLEATTSEDEENFKIQYDGGPSINIYIERNIDLEEEKQERAYLNVINHINERINANNEIKQELESDETLIQLIEEAGYGELEEILKLNIANEVSKKDRYKLAISEDEGNIRDFTNYIEDKLKNDFDYTLQEIQGIQYDSEELGNISNLIEAQNNALSETNDQIGAIDVLASIKVNGIINSEIIQPLTIRGANITEGIKDRYAVEQELMRQYGEDIENYNPVYETSEIDKNLSDMNKNISSLYDDINENNEQYLSFVDKTFESYDKNTDILIDSMYDATGTMEKTINTALEEAKDTKNITSKENQDLLDSFSRKLSYTRVGSIEYTEAYDFIVNPINFESSQEIVTPKVEDKKEEPIDTSSEKVSDEDKKTVLPEYVGLLIMGVGLSTLLIIFILLSRDKA